MKNQPGSIKGKKKKKAQLNITSSLVYHHSRQYLTFNPPLWLKLIQEEIQILL